MTEPILKTRNVFVDTQAYLQQRLRFDHPALRKLKDLGNSRMLRILSTDVVLGEVRKKISEQTSEALQSLKRFQKEAAFIEVYASPEIAPLFKSIDETALRTPGVNAWDKFLTEAKVQVVNSTVVRTPDLLEMYFSQSPPFGGAGKKYEFPDAISAITLDTWCAAQKTQLYIISGDSDMEAWCNGKPHLIYVPSLSEFLDLYNRSEEKLTQLAHQVFKKEEEWILSIIKERFLECSFVYDDNASADVENVRVTSIHVEDVNVIEVDEHKYMLALQVEIGFRASVTGPDYDHGSWDNEDKQYVYLPTFHVEVAPTERYDVSLEIIYDIADEEITEIEEVLFNDSDEITIYVAERWPYK